jgi:hypothetical protein
MPAPPPSPGLDGLDPISSILSSRSSLSFSTLFLTSPMFSFSAFYTFDIFLLDYTCILLIFPLISSIEELAMFCSAFDFLNYENVTVIAFWWFCWTCRIISTSSKSPFFVRKSLIVFRTFATLRQISCLTFSPVSSFT